MSTNIDANDWLMSSGVRSAKFDKIGAAVVGFIMRPPEIQAQRDINTGEPKFWKDGKPMLQVKVVLMTEERDAEDAEDTGERAIYVKGEMQRAVSKAIRAAGANGLEVGGKLMVRYVADGPQPNPRMNPPKMFEARYKKPEPSAVPVPESEAELQPTGATPAAARKLDEIPF